MINTPSVDDIEDFARTHPHVMFGVLLIPVTYAITKQIGTSLFVGGIVAFGPAIAEGFQDAQDSDTEPVEEVIDE